MPKKVKSIYISEKVEREIENLCEINDRSFSYIVNAAIEEYLSHFESEEAKRWQ